MSTHGDPHGADSAHHEEEVFPEEPRTPGWLPLLGFGVLLVGIFLFIIDESDGKSGQQLAEEAAAQAAAAAAPAAAGASNAAGQPRPQPGADPHPEH